MNIKKSIAILALGLFLCAASVQSFSMAHGAGLICQGTDGGPEDPGRGDGGGDGGKGRS